MNRVDLAEYLTKELQRGVFSDANALSDWLSSRGYTISSAPAQGALFPPEDNVRLLSSYRRASGKPSAPSGGDVSDQILRLMQEHLFSALTNSPTMSLTGVNIAALGRMVAEITKANILQKRYNMEIMERAHKAAHEMERVASRGGLSEESVEAIRTQILGIVDDVA